jgi:hypothetical protein
MDFKPEPLGPLSLVRREELCNALQGALSDIQRQAPDMHLARSQFPLRNFEAHD